MNPKIINFVRLGSRNSTFRKLKADENCILLNHAVKSKLPVPNAILLPDEAWQRMIEAGIVEVVGDDVTIHSADEFLHTFALSNPRKDMLIRAAFSANPPITAASLTELTAADNLIIPPNDKIALINALVTIWQSASPNTLRHILVMEAVTAQTSGTATTQAANEQDKVIFGNQQMMMRKLGRWQSADFPPSWQRRLQKLLRGIRRSFILEGTDWQIKWVDDGKMCWLTGIKNV